MELKTPAFSIRLGRVVKNMGEITVKPEHKPEQRGKTEGRGDFDRLALRSCVLGGFRPLWGKHAHDGLAQRDASIPKDGLTVVDGRFGWTGFLNEWSGSSQKWLGHLGQIPSAVTRKFFSHPYM